MFIWLLILLVGVFLMMRTGIKVQKEIVARDYSWRNFGLLSFAWLAITLSGFQSNCSEIGCQWSVQFGWLANLLHQIVPIQGFEPTRTIMLLICGYVIVTIYLLGHWIGWMLYCTRKLFQLAS